MSIRRATGITLAFVAIGAIAGAVTAAMSLTPLWLGLTGLPRDFASISVVALIAMVGVPFGAVLMPILGWLVLNRVSFWRAVFVLTLSAVLGENLAAVLLRNMDTGVVVPGAFVGALAGVLFIRLASSPSRGVAEGRAR
jgi:hypothetical protein